MATKELIYFTRANGPLLTEKIKKAEMCHTDMTIVVIKKKYLLIVFHFMKKKLPKISGFRPKRCKGRQKINLDHFNQLLM